MSNNPPAILRGDRYSVNHPGEVLAIMPPFWCPPVDHLCRAVYVARNMLAVEVVGIAWDMPETITVKFPLVESPAVYHEAFRLTDELFEKIVAKCAAKEAASGERSSEMVEIRRRFNAIDEMYARTP